MLGSTNSFIGGFSAPAVEVEPDTGGGSTDNETPDDGGSTSGEVISLTVLSQTQYVSGNVSSSFGSRHLVGASHYSDSIYNRFNLWMRYALTIPRSCSEIKFKASYSNESYNQEGNVVAVSPYKYSIGTSGAPGGSYKTFYWNTSSNTMSGAATGNFESGETVYLWLHYDYAGNNVCYVEGVSLVEVTGVTS